MIDVDEAALTAAQTRLGTETIEDTVNAALALVAGRSRSDKEINAALDTLARLEFSDSDREDMWQ